jgi:hypothetical protein
MKIIWTSLGASMLIACGSQPGANATIYVDPPQDPLSCVGVAGFEVTVEPLGKASETKRVMLPETILDAASCALPRFSIPDLDIDLPVNVTINGFDGGGKLRVGGEAGIMSLHENPVHLTLEAKTLHPLLVFERKPYLGGVPLSEVTGMRITTQMMGITPLLSVNRDDPGVFFDSEPGAYGISTIPPNGTFMGSITVAFSGPMPAIRDAKLTVGWNGSYYTAK